MNSDRRQKILWWGTWYFVSGGCCGLTYWLASPETAGQYVVVILASWFLFLALYAAYSALRPVRPGWKYACKKCDFTASGSEVEDMVLVMRSHKTLNHEVR